MKKHKLLLYEIIIAIIIIALLLLSRILGTTMVYDSGSCLGGDGYPATNKTFDDLKAPGTRFGVVTGFDWNVPIMEKYPDGEYFQFNNMSDSFAALENGRIDVALGFTDEIDAISKAHPSLAFIREPALTLGFGFGMPKTPKGEELCKKMNQYLKKLKDSGEYDRILAKWKDTNRQGDVMGKYHFFNENGTLKVTSEGQWTPMTFYVGETLTGFFIELVNGFCQSAGYKPQFETVSRSAGVAGTVNGEYDILANAVLITKERMDMMYITNPFMYDSIYFLVKADMKKIEVPKAAVFFSSLKESFQKTFITEDRYKVLLSGLGVTLLLSLAAGLFGTVLGGVVCYFRMRNNRWVEAAASLYIRIFRGIPIVVLLMVLY